LKNLKASKIPVDRSRLKIAFSGIKRTVNDNLLNFSYSPDCYGFCFRGGVLKSDLGINYADACYAVENNLRHTFQPIAASTSVENAFVYLRTGAEGAYDDRIVVHTNENFLYQTKVFTSDVWHLISGVSVSGKACSVNYNYNGDDCLLIASPTTPLTILNDNQVTVVQSAPRISSMCVHYERIFATDSRQKNAVWFSDDFDPTNWSVDLESGGFVKFADECGNVLKVVSFLDYVYIFREHGIFRLSAYAEQTEFIVSKVFASTGRIYADTISQYGDKIVFFADDGLYLFNGFDVQRIAHDLPDVEYKSRAVGVCFRDKYYMCCRFSDYVDAQNAGWTNNSLLELDLMTGLFSIVRGVDVKNLVAVNVHHQSGVLAVCGGGMGALTRFLGKIEKSGRSFSQPTEKHWESPCNPLSSERKKIVREVQLKTDADITLGVVADGVRYEYPVKGSPALQRVIIGKGGRSIGLTIDCQAFDCEITPPVVVLDLV